MDRCAFDGCDDAAARELAITARIPNPLGPGGHRTVGLIESDIRLSLCERHYEWLTYNPLGTLSIGT